MIRDLATSDEVAALRLLDVDESERRPPPASTAWAVRRRERPTPALGSRRSSRAATCSSTAPSYRVNLDAMRACLDAGCHYIDLGGLYR